MFFEFFWSSQCGSVRDDAPLFGCVQRTSLLYFFGFGIDEVFFLDYDPVAMTISLVQKGLKRCLSEFFPRQ